MEEMELLCSRIHLGSRHVAWRVCIEAALWWIRWVGNRANVHLRLMAHFLQLAGGLPTESPDSLQLDSQDGLTRHRR
jgi:hypothetical protein